MILQAFWLLVLMIACDACTQGARLDRIVILRVLAGVGAVVLFYSSANELREFYDVIEGVPPNWDTGAETLMALFFVLGRSGAWRYG